MTEGRERRRAVNALCLGVAGRRRRDIGVLSVLAVLATATAALLPLPLKYAIDDVLAPDAEGARGQVVLAGLAMLAIGASVQLVEIGRRRRQTATTRAMTLDVGAMLIDHLRCVDVATVGRYRAGDAVSRVTRDVAAVPALVLGTWFECARNVVFVAVFGIVLVSIDPRSAVVALVVAVLQAVVARLFARRSERLSRARAEGEASLMAHVDQSLSGLADIWTTDALDRETSRFRDTAAMTFAAARRSDTVLLSFGLCAALLTATGQGVVLLLGARDVLAGQQTVGSLLVIVAYLQQLQSPIERLAYAIPEGAAARAQIQRVLDFHADGIEIGVRTPVDEDTWLDTPTVRFESVWFAYDREMVVRDVSFVAGAGSVTALVGPTGAGKSTLVSMLPRLVDPVAGRVSIGGVDVRDLPVAQLRRMVAVVRQDPYLFPASVAENIAYGRPDATRAEIEAAAVASNAHGFISAMPQGYETLIGDGETGLSGGQRQRLAIARAVLKDAPVVVLDEPTSALDATTEAEVMEALAGLMARRTVLVIAHRLSTVRAADSIVVLDEGEVVERGTHEELLARSGLYHQLHSTQFRDTPIAGATS